MSANLRMRRSPDPTVAANGSMCDENKVNKIFTWFYKWCMDVWVCVCVCVCVCVKERGRDREREKELKIF